MQADAPWLSIAIGVGIGVVYVAASYISNVRALRRKRDLMLIVVATMLLRISIALIVLVGIIMLLPVTPTAVMGSFFVMFIVGLVVEIFVLHRRDAEPVEAGTEP
jgi:hypothetical protein